MRKIKTLQELNKPPLDPRLGSPGKVPGYADVPGRCNTCLALDKHDEIFAYAKIYVEPFGGHGYPLYLCKEHYDLLPTQGTFGGRWKLVQIFDRNLRR